MRSGITAVRPQNEMRQESSSDIHAAETALSAERWMSRRLLRTAVFIV